MKPKIVIWIQGELSTLTCSIFEALGHSVTHLKTLGYGFGSTSSICQDILKSANLLHKQDFVDSLMYTNVATVIQRKK